MDESDLPVRIRQIATLLELFDLRDSPQPLSLEGKNTPLPYYHVPSHAQKHCGKTECLYDGIVEFVYWNKAMPQVYTIASAYDFTAYTVTDVASMWDKNKLIKDPMSEPCIFFKMQGSSADRGQGLYAYNAKNPENRELLITIKCTTRRGYLLAAARIDKFYQKLASDSNKLMLGLYCCILQKGDYSELRNYVRFLLLL